MNIQRARVAIEVEHDFNSMSIGDYTCEASVTDGGQLVVKLVEFGLHDVGKSLPNGKVIVIRFNNRETHKIRSALSKGGN